MITLHTLKEKIDNNLIKDIQENFDKLLGVLPKTYKKEGYLTGSQTLDHYLGTRDIIVQLTGGSWSNLTSTTIDILCSGEYKLLMLEVK